VSDQKRPARGKSRSRPLRAAAEEKLAHAPGSPQDLTEKTLHELQVHQIEIDMQNEELKRVQLALEESRDKYLDLYDFAPVGYFTLTRAGHIAEVNLAGAEMLGLGRPKLVRHGLGRFVSPEDLDRWDRHLVSVLQSAERQTCELALKREDGLTFYAHLDSLRLDRPAREAGDGGPGPAIRVAMSDISDRKQIEDTQQFLLECGCRHAGEDFFKSLAIYLAQSLGMDYVCIDRLEGDRLAAQTVAVYTDGKLQDDVEYTLKDTPCGDVVGKTICCFPKGVRQLFPKDSALQKMKAESYVGTTLWSFEGKPIGLIAIIGRRPLVNPRPAELVLKLVAVRAAAELERKQAEEALHAADERVREIVRLSPAFMCILHGREHVFEMCNERYRQIVGRRDILSLPIRRALPELEGQGFFELLDGVFETGKPFSGKEVPVRLQRTPGKPLEEVYVDFVYMPLREADGSISDLFVHGVDTTEQVLARRRIEQLAQEAQRAAEELERSNKDLEQFAYVASHDLQEPLRGVHGFLTLLQNGCEGKLEGKALEYIQLAVRGADRMSGLISDLLEYSRVQTQARKPRPTDMKTVFDHAVANCRASIDQVEATVTCDDLPTVLGDPPQLVQLLQNLIGNAIKFRRPDVRPEVRVGARREAGQWLFWTKDNGIGIAPDQTERIFQIFQRLHTREQYPGTGIGLAICRKIVERHDGRIWVESIPGEGSTFSFTIPA